MMKQQQKDKIKVMVFHNLDNIAVTIKAASPNGIVSMPVLNTAIRLSKFNEFTPGLELFQSRYNTVLDSLHIAMLSAPDPVKTDTLNDAITVIKDAFVKGMK